MQSPSHQEVNDTERGDKEKHKISNYFLSCIIQYRLFYPTENLQGWDCFCVALQ